MLCAGRLYCTQVTPPMAKISKDWQQCIADLLKRHGLGFRDARRKGEYLFSHTSVASWANEGLIPTYSADLARFLELISSREEACECLMAAAVVRAAGRVRIETCAGCGDSVG